VDILQRLKNDRWNLIEVKSSTSAKEVYLVDAAIQYYVLNGAGIVLDRAGVLHLNNQYVYDGAQIDLQQLFHFTDLTAEIGQRQFTIAFQVESLDPAFSRKKRRQRRYAAISSSSLGGLKMKWHSETERCSGSRRISAGLLSR
jgi:hypothetical protein